MSFRSLKILPLLIFVAMLAFSVRLVEVVTGVSAIAGSAHAESKKKEDPKEEPKVEDKGKKEEKKEEETKFIPDAPGQDTLKGSMDTDSKGALEFPEESGAETVGTKQTDKKMDVKDDAIGWQSPTDTELDYSKSRKDLGDDLAGRRAALDARERELQTKEALLKAGEQELDRKFQELSQLKKEIENLLKQQSDEETARIASLVKIYEGMKPAEAARIFDTLDVDLLTSVIAKMSERKISPIMAAMNPERAKTVTMMLADQKKLPDLLQGQ
jgi:flagellar motility protein MotE (MotC chaperone)